MPLWVFSSVMLGMSQPGSLPLISQLQAELENAQATHPQAYHGRGRLLQQGSAALTPETTVPYRLHVDYASLYPDKAPPYSACFAAGEWFRRGLPTSTSPPADGVETCVRGPGEVSGSALSSGCWGRCLPDDVITAAGRRAVMDVVNAIVGDMGKYFSVTPPAGNLTFSVSRGAYERALTSRGYDVQPACSADCTVLSNAAVEPFYCTTGVRNADAVLSITKPPGVQGIAGTGSSCASDQNGRPLWLVFAWHSSLAPMESRTLARNLEDNRGLVMHEILHGMGFINSAFNYARDSSGNRKNLIKLSRVVDQDGAVDEVWHFTKGRAFEMAQLYFNCDANTTTGVGAEWHGLPLMGLPETGRASHWETRIMRDDVMSYGFMDAMSSITLAAMEDLGHYLANYSAAECMHWGAMQGCAYVKSRCGIAFHDRSAVTAGRQDCYGDDFWPSYADPYLTAKCALGHNPCSTAVKAGFETRASDMLEVCDAQCYEGASANCKASPQSAVETTILGGVLNTLSSLDWQAWLIPAVWLVGGLSLLGFIRRVVCPPTDRAFTISYVLAVLVAGFSAIIVFCAVYVWNNFEAFEAFVGKPTIVVSGASGAVFLAVALAMIIALMYSRHYAKDGSTTCSSASTITLGCGFYLFVLLTIAEILFTLLVIYWVYTLGGIPSDAVSAILGNAQQHAENFLAKWLQKPVAIAEGLVCRTYVTCCRDPKLGIMDLATNEAGSGYDELSIANITSIIAPPGGHGHTHGNPVGVSPSNATCYSASEGAQTDIQLALTDPSQPLFCEYTSGANPKYLVNPPPATCLLIQSVAGRATFALDQCRDDFCQAGTDGYLSFIQLVVDLMKRYSLPLGGAFAALVVVQLVFACNLRHARRIAIETRGVKKEHNAKIAARSDDARRQLHAMNVRTDRL